MKIRYFDEEDKLQVKEIRKIEFAPVAEKLIVDETWSLDLYDLIYIQDLRQKATWFDVGSLSCRCSNCGCKNDTETRFCPNCGAKMEVYNVK